MSIKKPTHVTKVICTCGHSQMVPSGGKRVKCAVCGAYLWFQDDSNDETTHPVATIIHPDTYPYVDKRPQAIENWRRIKR